MSAKMGRPKKGNEKPEHIRRVFKSRFYYVWSNLRKRCTYQKSKDYKNYGGRGITYDPRWEEFENFYDDMYASYAPGLEIDRINNDGNYEPTNCRWVTPAQNRQYQPKTKRYTYNGRTLLLSEWAEELGIRKGTLQMRITGYKWPISKVLEKRS